MTEKVVTYPNSYHSRYVAKIVRTGTLLFSGPGNDMKNESHCWYSHDDGNNYDCSVVMDNKQFSRMLKNGDVEFVKTEVPKNQLSIF